MPSVERLKELLGTETSVRVYSAAAPSVLMGEGKVVAVCEAPSFCVESPNGVKTWHSSQLPVKVETWQHL